MTHYFYLNGYVFDLVTISIGVIGITIPVLFTLFVTILLRRHSKAELEFRGEMKDFMIHLGVKYAAELIAKRQRVMTKF